MCVFSDGEFGTGHVHTGVPRSQEGAGGLWGGSQDGRGDEGAGQKPPELH